MQLVGKMLGVAPTTVRVAGDPLMGQDRDQTCLLSLIDSGAEGTSERFSQFVHRVERVREQEASHVIGAGYHLETRFKPVLASGKTCLWSQVEPVLL